ncbi:hypothetical protein N7481_001465 [Penicillium waksmanii]|uniref:uncharacterized protein n=1 Tax=Penicillium waksmanii TaxID=69791 RepID=UPI00254945D2|nr:uncharacterized protein N7481_001465 [Penicillium waksmanii]KAJ6001056.1 hypothetical protein N7481_001465 [Penicillium waksmanii]
MQILNQMRLTRGAPTSLLVSRCRQENITRTTRSAIFLQHESKGLATNTKDHENDTKRSSKADPNQADSNSKELPESSSVADETKSHDEYYSLKMHREGPNTESGELDSKSKSKEVKDHNKAMGNRYDKR